MMFNNDIYHMLNTSTFYITKHPELNIYIEYALIVLIIFTCLQCFTIESSKSKKDNNKPQLNKTQMTQYIETLIKKNVNISCQQENPKRLNTLSNVRYEKYKTATTLQQVIELGGSKRDIAWDIQKSYMVFQDSSHYNEFVKILNKSK